MQIPPKVKIFIRKATHDIIAAEANLFKHHVPINSRCVLCGFYWANTTHVMFFCQGIKKAWSSSEWWPMLKTKKSQNMEDILTLMRDKLTRSNWESFCMRL